MELLEVVVVGKMSKNSAPQHGVCAMHSGW